MDKIFENDMIIVSTATKKDSGSSESSDSESDNDIPVIKMDDFTFKLVGFGIVRDNAGDDLLYYKWKHNEKLILYCMTDHPGSREALGVFILVGQLGGYAVRDLRDYLKEIIRTKDEIKSR